MPLGAGLAGMLDPAGMAGDPALGPDAGSHWRYLSGLLFAIGLGFWSCLPAIERRGGRFRLLAGLVLLGGLARLYGLAVAPLPAWPMLFGLAMELLVTPALAAWQWRVARPFATP